jgi:hypothetical protein
LCEQAVSDVHYAAFFEQDDKMNCIRDSLIIKDFAVGSRVTSLIHCSVLPLLSILNIAVYCQIALTYIETSHKLCYWQAAVVI